MNLRERIQVSPVWVGGAVSGVAFAVVFTAFEIFFQRVPLGFSLVAAPFEALLFGGFMGLFLARARRALGGVDTANELTRAIKGGRVPEGVDTIGWVAALNWRKRQSKTTLWLGPVFFGVLALLDVWLALSAPIWWLLVVVFVVFAVYTPLASARDLRRIETVHPQLIHQYSADR
jgi:hypothetical protein